MNIKQLKDNMKIKADMYADELRNKTGEEFTFKCHIGRKKIELFLQGDDVATLFNMEIEYVRGGWMACNVSQFAHRTWHDGKKEDIHAPKILQLVIDYLKGYAEIKEMVGFFVNFNLLNAEYGAYLTDALTKEGFIERVKNNFLVTSLDSPYRCFSYVQKEDDETLQKVELLENELDVLHKENPLFIVDEYDSYSPVDSPFKINYRLYYYEGEKFSITLCPDNKVLAGGRKVDDKEYEIVAGIGEIILQDIEEHQRLYNLINAPCKFTMEVLGKMGLHKGADGARDLIASSDIMVGIGNTEKAMKVISDVLKGISNNPYESSIIKAKKNFLYKEYNKQDFVIYRLKVENTFWFLGRYKYEKPFIYPSKNDVIPKEVMRFICTNIEQDIMKQF